MPNPLGADPRPSRTLQSLDRFTPEGIQALAAAGLVLAEAINEGRLVINTRLPAGKSEATYLLIDRLYVLQDALHGDSSKLPAALASFLRIAEGGENGENHG